LPRNFRAIETAQGTGVQKRKEHQMHTKIIIAASAVLFATTSSFAYSNIDMDHEVHGTYTSNISSDLADRGIKAERLEEWGDAIRVDAVDANGESYVVIVSTDTLQPLYGTAVR
jgi:hypothetical protein